MINPQKPVINPIKICNRFTALEITQHKDATTPDKTFKSATAPKPPWQKQRCVSI